MRKINLRKPLLIYLYGFPGSGKSYVAANLAKSLQVAHISSDKVRTELFTRPTGSQQEEAIASKLALYITKELLGAGLSVIYDGDTLKASQRRALRQFADSNKAGHLMIWLQIDPTSAFTRTITRDRRTMEGKYTPARSKDAFDRYVAAMENPESEQYIVVSGKHSFASQKSAIISRLYQLGLVDSSVLTENVIKPELVNLIPQMPRPGSNFGPPDQPL